MANIEQQLKTIALKPINYKAIRISISNLADIAWWLGTDSVRTTTRKEDSGRTAVGFFQGDGQMMGGYLGDWVIEDQAGLKTIITDAEFNATYDIVDSPDVPDPVEEDLPEAEEPIEEAPEEDVPDTPEIGTDEPELPAPEPTFPEDVVSGIQAVQLADPASVLQINELVEPFATVMQFGQFELGNESDSHLEFEFPDGRQNWQVDFGDWVVLDEGKLQILGVDAFNELYVKNHNNEWVHVITTETPEEESANDAD